MPESNPTDNLPSSSGVNRAEEGEGFRAPFAKEKGEIQHSIYDGTGNEQVVVTTTDADGNRKQGTGASAEEARKSAQESDEALGEGFGTGRQDI